MWSNSGQRGTAWYPTAAEIAAIAKQGLDVLILGRNWMSQPGAAGKTLGDYRPADADALRTVIAACHAAGVRVGLSMLGQEQFVLATNTAWIARFLKQDFDGVMVEETHFLAPRGDLYPKTVTPDGEPLAVDDGHAGRRPISCSPASCAPRRR